MPLESLPKMKRRVQSDSTKYLVRQLTCLLVYNQMSILTKKTKHVIFILLLIKIKETMLKDSKLHDQLPYLHRTPWLQYIGSLR